MIDLQGTLFRIHVVSYGDGFLNASETGIVKAHSRDILIHNYDNNPNYWCMCALYELKKENGCGSTLYMDCIIIFAGIRSNF